MYSTHAYSNCWEVAPIGWQQSTRKAAAPFLHSAERLFVHSVLLLLFSSSLLLLLQLLLLTVVVVVVVVVVVTVLQPNETFHLTLAMKRVRL